MLKRKKPPSAPVAEDPIEAVSRFDTPEDTPGFLLWRVSADWQRRLRKELDELELTHVQFVILSSVAWLSRMQPKTSQVDVARFAKIDVMTTSKSIRALQARGLIERSSDAQDARSKCLELTPNAQELLKRAITAVEAADVDFFKPLGADLESFKASMKALLTDTPG